MPLVAIQDSVGRNGRNLTGDVGVIAAALVEVGPDRGGIYGPPLSVEGLAQAIEGFQSFQRLPARDGRVDRGGGTLRRINEILHPGEQPKPPSTPTGTGEIRPLNTGMPQAVSKNTWSPVESSLVSEFVFQWGGAAGGGTISYFQLDEQSVPRWFGVLVPSGTTSFDKVHIFFHPTPGQAGYQEAQYHTLGNWGNIFHYLSDDMGAQFCAAAMGRVLFMPLMTDSAAGTCGMFPERWESIVSRICGMCQSGDMSPNAAPVSISSVVVSSFSSGITYSHNFRRRAALGGRLAGVIDFDGGISSYKQYSAQINMPLGRVVRMQQMPASAATLLALSATHTFPLPKARWGGPWANLFSPNEGKAVLEIHGTIPQTMMFIAAKRAG